jgi:carboxyl-terminal processing protease
MKIHWRARAHIGVILAPMVVGLGLMIRPTPAQQNAAAPAVAAAPQLVADAEYASQISRLVQNGQIDALARLSIPASASTAKLKDWTSQFLSEIQSQEKQRDKQYSDAVGKAQEELKADHFAKAMESTVLAYRIAKDPEAFLKLEWVRDITSKVQTRASDFEKQGKWLESLQLYSSLNTLYEIDTRYKADALRLARRARLLAAYTPRVLLQLRKELADKERDPASTQPAAPEITDSDLAGFTPWQKTTERITVEMMHRVLQNSQENWVETTTYKDMVSGGAEAMRLFLTTPELAKEFPGLNDAAARLKFNAALDAAITSAAAPGLSATDVDRIVETLADASAATVKLPREVIIMEFTDGAIEKLDQFTSVVWPHEVAEFEKNMTGNFGGVGIQISLEKENVKPEQAALNKLGGSANDPASKDMTVNSQYRLVVITPLPDTPAFKAGIQAGDIITGIDGKSTVGITVDQAVSSIMGVPGTSVVLKVKRGDKFEKDFKVTRDTIKVVSVKGFKRNGADHSKWDFMLDQESKIGYVSITGFQEDTPLELEDTVAALLKQGMRGLVLDLRFNPGGYLQAAVKMCDDFLEDGNIVSTRGRSSLSPPQAWRAHANTIIPNNMPMIVLVNEYSASASEIFAGAMKGRRAMIIGHRTYGKGSVQQLLRFGSNTARLPESELKLTMAYYYLPNGESLHRRDGQKTWGVDPDVVVDMTPDQLTDLLKARRENDIIRPADEVATAPATAASAPAATPDTQLETAMLMMRLQLVQSK